MQTDRQGAHTPHRRWGRWLRSNQPSANGGKEWPLPQLTHSRTHLRLNYPAMPGRPPVAGVPDQTKAATPGRFRSIKPELGLFLTCTPFSRGAGKFVIRRIHNRPPGVRPPSDGSATAFPSHPRRADPARLVQEQLAHRPVWCLCKNCESCSRCRCSCRDSAN